MYFLEILKKFIDKTLFEQNTNNQQPMIEENDYENCSHLLAPVDSTGEILACTKCGMVFKKKDLPPENFFKSEGL